MRYRGTYFTIKSSEIDKYISAWQVNYKKYLELKEKVIMDGELQIVGESGMAINVGGYRDGVCINRWNMNVHDQSRIEKIVSDYKMCKGKAPTIQNMLRSLV